MKTRIETTKSQVLGFVTVFCGAGPYKAVDPTYLQIAEDLGRTLAQNHIGLIYGAGQTGMMGKVAQGALESGGCVYGYTTEAFVLREGLNSQITEIHTFSSLSHRKQLLIEKGDIYIALPGGIGTVDEMFDVLALFYAGVMSKRLIIVNVNNYWDEILLCLEKMRKESFLDPELSDGFVAVQSVDEAIDIVLKTLKNS